jgi:type II secretory pathway predicted ATPase ExeA
MPLELKEYNLTANPFPSDIGVPPAEVILWADRSEVKSRVLRLINSSISDRKSNLFLVVGKYGQGKTHTLRYFETYVNSEKMADATAIFISGPGNNFVDLYRKFVSALGRDRILQHAKEFSGSIFLAYVKKLISDVEKGVLNSADFPFYVTTQELVRSNVRGMLREMAGSDLPDFASVLIQLPDKSKEELAWKWLTARKMSASELRDTLAVASGIETEEDAVRAIKALLDILHQIGFKMVFLFIDEMEYLELQLDEKARQLYTSHLRELVDNNPDGLGIFLSCAAESERDFKTTSDQAFISRMPRSNEILLDNLSQSDMKHFIMDYLDQARISLKSKDDNERLRPFDESSLAEIFKRSDSGDMRSVVRLCSILLDEGRVMSLKPIDAKAVGQIASRIKL